MGSTGRRIVGPLRGIMAAMALVAALLSLAILPARASAAEIVDSGTCGTCPWTVDSDGTLTIGAGTLASNDESSDEFWPWTKYQWGKGPVELKKVVTDGKVVGGENLSYCFRGLSSLESVDVSTLDTSSVTNMNNMFSECSLTSIDLSAWDVSSVTDMSYMFYFNDLTSIDTTGWDTSSVTDISSMFRNCRPLTSLDLSGWDTSRVTNMESLFQECYELKTLDISDWDTSSVTNMWSMFRSCRSLETLDLSGWDTSSVTDMYSVFSGCGKLASLDLSGWDTSSVTTMESMFNVCYDLASLDVSGWDTSSVTNMRSMFSCCDTLTSLDLSGWDTSSVTDMSAMFYECFSLANLNVSNWDTSSAVYLGNLFNGCYSLKSLDLSGWDTSSAGNMFDMFKGCSSLKSLDLSGWDTSSVVGMGSIFEGCSSIKSLDLSDWDTSSVLDMQSMFKGCSSLQSLDLSGWNTSSAEWISNLFNGCSSLESLDLSGWDTSAATSYMYMFFGCESLESITVGGNYQIKGADMFPDATAARGWWSVADGTWYSKEEICANRSGVFDTYLSQGSGPEWKRLAGSGRYDTMAEIVSEGWSGQTGGTVVVATGEGFKDALAAAGLAGLDGGPVVLTAGKSLSRQAEAQLKALKPSKVYVAGGTFAVSDGVLSSIQKATGVEPVRVAGKTSASTSAELALAGKGRWDGTAIIATNKSFKDALSVAPLSYAKRWPILLADNGKSLNADVIAALKDCGIRRAYIVGGKLAVTANVESQLKKAGVELADRLSGANGPATSRAIADFALENGLTVANMAFATSQNFPDALAGAALCGRNGSVLLLCDDKAQANLSFATDHASQIECGYVFGGEMAFSKGLFDRLPR